MGRDLSGAALEDAVDRWKSAVIDHRIDDLAQLLHPDCRFSSPVLFKPVGKDILLRYLNVARGERSGSKISYERTWQDADSAALEYVSVIDGLVYNGLEILDIDPPSGLVASVKIFLRPARAVDATLMAMVREG